MIKVSIVIPVYNVEGYLPKSVASVQNQTLKDIEIILVNDGSADGSLDLCRKYAEKDVRIKVIDKPNGGVSSARNAGIEASGGEYIGFVDPDDWVEPEMFESMYNKAEEIEADACMCNYSRNTERKPAQIPLGINHDLHGREAIVNELIAGILSPPGLNSGTAAIMGNVWRCLFKRQLINSNNIRFIEGLSFMEDTVFCIQAFSKCGCIAIDEGYYYNYRIILRSATASYKKDFLKMQRQVYGIMEQTLHSEKLDTLLQERMDIRYVNMDFDLIANETHKDNPKTYRQKIKSILEICRDRNLKRILSNVDTSGYTLRKRFILNALKREASAAIYIYYSVITRLL